MMDRERTQADYTPEFHKRVKQTCLYVATVLGEWMDSVTVVGGLVPSLLIPQDQLPDDASLHPGTLDLDLGLDVAILDDQGYASISAKLRSAGFRPDRNEAGADTRQTWRTDPSLDAKVTVDFLIPRRFNGARGGKLQDLERDFAAIVTDGLHLVQRDRQRVKLEGMTIRGEQATRDIYICGVGSFVVLKARATHLREEAKDAFDLCYVIRNYGKGIVNVAHELEPLLDDSDAQEAVRWLEQDFGTIDSIGPKRVARFVRGQDDDETQADAMGSVLRLLDTLRQ